MILIKKMTSENWKDFVGDQANVMIVRKELIDGVREIGIVRWCWQGREWEPIMISGSTWGKFGSMGDCIKRWQHVMDFFYIEIKP
jgi:hypothetical protein